MVGPLVRARRLAAAFSLPLILGTCTEGGIGPSRHRAALAVTTTLPSAADLASFNLVIDNVRLIVVRPPAETLFDQVVAFPASQTSLQLSATVDLQQEQETLEVTIQLLSGSQVLFSGTQSLQVTSGPNPAPAVIPVTYAGPGSNVSSLTIDPQDSVLSFGGTMTFRLTGRDAQNNIVPSFYVSWTTSDTNVAKIDATGHLTAPLVRGTFAVRAYTWDSVTTSTPITFAPVATAINLVSGCTQVGLPGVQLPQPVVVRVIAGDGLGVKGVAIQFTPPPGGSVTPAQAATDAAGLAQTLVTLGPVVGPTSLSIGATGLTAVTCNQTVQTSATMLVFTQPAGTGDVVAGTPFTRIVVAQDALGNTATNVTGTVTLDIGANPGGITFGSRSVAAVAGVATFSNITIDKVGIGYTLVATSGTLTPATTAPFNVVPAAPAQLVFSVQPSTVGAGSPILPPVVVAAQDAFGNPTPAFVANVSIAIGTNPSNGVLGGVLIQPAIAGVVTFPALTIDKVGTGYTLVASSAGLTDAVSTAFTVTTVPATQLAFTTQPSNVTAGSGIAPPIVVTAMDALGNPDASFTGAVTIAIGTNPSGGVLGGTATTNAIAGVATFGSLSINKSGAGYTLVATASGVTGATSTSFNVNAGAATQLAFAQQPPVSLVAGTGFTIVVTAQDNLGNTATTFTGNISLAFGSHPLGSVLTGTSTVAAVSGVATFSNLGALTVAGGYTLVASSSGFQSVVSNSFTVTPAAATALAFITQPSTVTAGAVMSPAVQVAVQDSFANTVTSATNPITLSLTVAGGATLGGTLTRNAASGVATFTGLTVDLAGAYTLSAVATSLSGTTSAVFNVTPGTVASLLVSVTPSVDTAGAPRTITVTARDLIGNTVTGYLGTVVFTSSDPLALLPANYTFTAGDNGVHPFPGASLRTVGSQSVTATDIANSLITGTQSGSVTPGTAAALFFTVQPVGTSVGAAITPPVQVTARDGFGNTATGFTGAVTVAIGINPGGATLGGTTTVSAIAGIATFAGLTLSQAGTGYTLTAAATGLTGATSTPFNISLVGATLNAWNTGNGSWSVAANWSLGRVPNATDSVAISLNGTYTVTLDTTISIAFLTFGGSSGVQTLAMSGRTLTVTNAVTVQSGANTTVNGGTIGGPAGLTNHGTLTLGSASIANAFDNPGTLVASGTSQLSGPLTTTAGDSIIVRGNGTFGAAVLTTSGGSWTNNGAIVLTDVTSSYGATLTVPGGTLTNAPGATIEAPVGTNGDRTLNAALINQGTVTVGAAAARKLQITPPAASASSNIATITINSGTLQLTLSGTSPTFTNAGVIDLTGGTFSINQPSGGGAGTLALSATGQIAIGAARTMTVTGGLLTVPSGAVITGTGTLALSGATANVTPSFNTSLTGLSLLNSTWNGPGTLTSPSGKTLNLQASTINAPFVNGGTLLATGTSQITGSFTTQSGDSLIVQGNGTFGAGVLTVSGGSWTNNGAIVLTDVTSSYGATLTVPAGTLTNPGGATIEAPLGTSGDRTLNATLINQGTVTVGVAAARKLQITPPGGTASSNSATITINSGLLQISQSGVSPTFTNSGTIQLAGGDFSLSQPSGGAAGLMTTTGTWTIGASRTLTVSGGTLDVNLGAMITGTGTLALSGATANVTPNFNTSLTGLTLLNSTWSGTGTLTNPAGKALNLQSSTVTAPLVNAGTLTATGTSQIGGNFTTQSGDSLIVQGNGTFGAGVLTVSGGSWTNNGAIVLTDIVSSYGATLTVPTGTLTNPSGRTIEAPLGTNGDRTINATLINQGTVTVGVAAARKLQITPPAGTGSSNSATITINSGLLQVTQSGTNPSFTNSGTIQLVGGSFSLGQPSGVNFGTLTTDGTLAIGSGRTVTVTGGVLTMPAGATITGSGTLSLSGATANVTPNFNTSLTGLTLLNSTWNGPGTLTNPSGKTLNIQASTINAPFVNGGTLLSTGTSAITGVFTTGTGDSIIVQGNGTFGAATLTVSGGAWTNNGAIVLTDVVSSYGAILTVPTGTLTNVSGATIEALLGTNGDRALNATLDNQGTLTVGTAAARKLTIAPPASGEITNSGTITVNSGTLQANLTGTNPFSANQGTITLAGGDLALSQPSGASAGTFATPGAISIGTGRTFSVTGGSFQVPVNGVITGAGTLALSNDSAAVTPNFNTGSTRLSLLSSVWLGSGILTNASGVTLNLQNSEINAAFDNQGTLVATGTSVLSGSASTTSSSVIQVQGNGTFGAATLHVTTFGGLTNNGTINLTEVVSGYGSTLIVDNGLTNASGGQLQTFTGFNGPRTLTADLTNSSGATVTIARTLTLNQPAGTHSNAGLIQLVGGDLIVQFSSGRPGISNTGLIDVGTNTMKVFGPASAFINQAGGTLQGSGTFDVTGTSFITNGITVVGSSPGIMKFVGPYLQGPSPSVLKVEIGGSGAAPGTAYDQLQATDNVQLQGGTLDVTQIAAVAGELYVIITVPAGKTITGDFQSKIGLGSCSSGVSGTAYVIAC